MGLTGKVFENSKHSTLGSGKVPLGNEPSKYTRCFTCRVITGALILVLPMAEGVTWCNN